MPAMRLVSDAERKAEDTRCGGQFSAVEKSIGRGAHGLRSQAIATSRALSTESTARAFLHSAPAGPGGRLADALAQAAECCGTEHVDSSEQMRATPVQTTAVAAIAAKAETAFRSSMRGHFIRHASRKPCAGGNPRSQTARGHG